MDNYFLHKQRLKAAKNSKPVTKTLYVDKSKDNISLKSQYDRNQPLYNGTSLIQPLNKEPSLSNTSSTMNSEPANAIKNSATNSFMFTSTLLISYLPAKKRAEELQKYHNSIFDMKRTVQ